MAPEVGFDAAKMKSMTTERLGSLAESKKSARGRNWLPPASEPQQDYVCELTEIIVGQSRDGVVFFRPVFRIADDDHRDDKGGSLMGKHFGQGYWLDENRKGIATSALVALYGEKDCPDAWEVALDPAHLDPLNGCFYLVAVRANSRPQYPPNVYINSCLGKGKDTAPVEAA
jgi:hypothetical protein